MRNAVRTRSRRGDVLNNFIPDKYGIHGVFNQKMRLRDRMVHSMEPGQQITIRGPYGNGFPVDDVFAGRDLLFIAGGIGLAPLRSVINYCRHYRDRYGKIDIVYGSRSMQDLVDYNEIIDEWAVDAGVSVHLTIDKEQPEWSGHVGFVPNYVKELAFQPTRSRFSAVRR